MIPNFLRWWDAPSKSSELPNTTAPTQPAPASAKTASAPAIKAKIPTTGVELFMNASGIKARDEVLQEHPFWQQPDVAMHVGAPVVGAVIEHITCMAKHYSWRHYDEDMDSHAEAMLNRFRGLQWGETSGYERWHKRAVELIQTQPEHAQLLLDALTKHVEVNLQEISGYWLVETNSILELNGTISTNTLLSGLSKLRQMGELVKYPFLHRAIQEPAREDEILQWVRQNHRTGPLVASFHHKLHSWRMADEIPAKELIVKLAETTKYGALLKAWHGIALTGEETLQHPLAYSLYVHKHAPIYLEEACPLPDTWSVALSLSTTGVEFQEMLLNAARLKMAPTQKLESWAIPDLEP